MGKFHECIAKYLNFELCFYCDVCASRTVKLACHVKMYTKNMLRIFQAHLSEKVKNTEAQRKFHHSYKKKRVSVQDPHKMYD